MVCKVSNAKSIKPFRKEEKTGKKPFHLDVSLHREMQYFPKFREPDAFIKRSFASRVLCAGADFSVPCKFAMALCFFLLGFVSRHVIMPCTRLAG